jgi:hypothetical protein
MARRVFTGILRVDNKVYSELFILVTNLFFKVIPRKANLNKKASVLKELQQDF